jgi:hypothetical protein
MAKKKPIQLKDLSRFELINYYHVHVGSNLGDFKTSSFWKWVKSYFKARFGGKEPFRFYPSQGDDGIYPLIPNENGNVVVAIASDWATNTVDSVTVGNLMEQEEPDYSIHLGDVYYVGEPSEIEENFGKMNDPNDTGDWAYGKNGFLAVPGNHEFYSKGTGFYENLLSKTNVITNTGNVVKQKAGFFCLENDHWRIIGIDTGYTSVGIPVWEFISPANCKLLDEQVAWLRDIVKLGDPNDNRGIIMLSHHQYYSAFENGKSYEKPAQQLAEIMGETKSEIPVIWFWGHQHRLAIHGKNSVGGGINAYGRCIGHGGMPVDLVDFTNSFKVESFTEAAKASKLLYYDNRFHGIEDRDGNISDKEEDRVGYNGFAKMTFNENTLLIEHIQPDEVNKFNRNVVFVEKWTIDISNGVLSFELSDDQDTILTKFSAK